MYHAACKVDFQPFTLVLTADVFHFFRKLLITILLFVVVKTIEDNSLCHPRFHRANTTNQPCMVYGLVLQVQTYCAQYNIRKTTTNSSTIGKEKDHSLCHPQFHTARTTNRGVWHCRYVWTYWGQYIRKQRVFVTYHPLPIAV